MTQTRLQFSSLFIFIHELRRRLDIDARELEKGQLSRPSKINIEFL
jgi:hypothetical protein